jgi:thioesterase domain-containing protein
MSAASNLQSVLHEEIPLTRDMKISVVHCNDKLVELSAPLEPNINHKCSAFGGSLYSVAVLCGWGFIFNQMQLNNLSGHIVIQHSEVDYRLPVDGEIRAICELHEQTILQRFIKTFLRKKRARIKLQINIIYNGEKAMQFIGHYVIHK